MYVKQISVFIENREGRLDDVLETLRDNEINIQSMSLADTSEYGLLRMIVSDPDKAHAALKKNGFSAMLTNVIVVAVEHEVGKLQEIICCLGKENVNIEYMYSISTTTGEMPLVIKTSDLEKTIDIIKKQGARIITC